MTETSIAEPPGSRPLRLLAAAASLAFVALALLLLRAILVGADPFLRIQLPLLAAATTAGGLSAWLALRGDRAESRAQMLRLVRAGVIVGGASLVLGFVGPILLAPDAPQGPLLGLFITGPLGFVAGVVGRVVLDAVGRPGRGGRDGRGQRPA